MSRLGGNVALGNKNDSDSIILLCLDCEVGNGLKNKRWEAKAMGDIQEHYSPKKIQNKHFLNW